MTKSPTEAVIDESSDATAALLRTRSEEIGELRAKLEQQEAQTELWRKRALDAEGTLSKDVTDLRGQLLDALLAAERLRGFYDATEAAKPARMVPEQREGFTPPDLRAHSRDRYGHGGKPWYAR